MTTTPVIAALAWTLLHSLWQGVLVAGLAYVYAQATHSPRLRYGIYLAGVATTVVLGGWTFVDVYQPPQGSFAGLQPSTTGGQLLAWLVMGWGLGVSFMTTRLAHGLWQLEQLRRQCRPLTEDLRQRVQTIASDLGIRREVGVAESVAVDSPLTLGWLRPLILLPVGTVARLPAEVVEAALVHELAHIRRHDFAVHVAVSLVRGMYFYHPAVWWLCARVEQTREHCCDDVVCAYTKDPLHYALALTQLEAARVRPASSAMAATGGDLMTRVQRLVSDQPSRRGWLAPFASIVCTLCLAAVVVPACLDSEEPASDPSQQLEEEDQAQVEEISGELEAPERAPEIAQVPVAGPTEVLAEPLAEPLAEQQPDDLGIAWLPADIRVYANDIRTVSARHGVDPQLVAIVTMLESGGNPEAKSPAGARGLMQLMPQTAAKIAKKRKIADHSESRLDDPTYNLDMGTYLLGQLQQQFADGDALRPRDVERIAAAYNAGSGRLREALAGKRPLSAETRRYKKRVRDLWGKRESESLPD